MDKALKPFIEWLGGNWGWAVAVFCVFFEIAPIKIHPVTSLFNWVGKKLTGDIRRDISDLRRDTDASFARVEQRMNEAEKQSDLQRMAGIKALVLDFANSTRNGRGHSKEEYDNVMSENNIYEALIKKYNLSNDVYRESYKYIKSKYQECLRDNSFLS